MYRLLPLAIILACTTPNRSELHDGAWLPPPVPRTAYTPVGTGLPEHWGQPEPTPLPHSPYKRQLPPSREPGLWAPEATAVDGAASHEVGPVVFGFPLPFSPDATSEADRQPTLDCARGLTKALADSGAWKRLLEWDMAKRACAVAHMYLLCADGAYVRAKANAAASKHATEVIALALSRARDNVGSSCSQPVPRDVISLAGDVIRAMRRSGN